MQIRTARDIGALIRGRRRELGLDQATLAARVGVSRQWLIEVERGKPRAGLTLVLRTMEALGLRLEVGSAKVARERKTTRIASPPDIDAIVNAARKPR